MVIFDTEGKVVEDPDLLLGQIEYKSIDVVHSWVVDEPEKGHWETIAEYPNGGKDIEWQVDAPESGHWETRDQEGELVEHFDGIIPDDLPREEQHPDIWQYAVYTPYTEEEITKMQRDNQIAELKGNLASTDYTVIKVYEAMVTGDALPDDEAERYAEIITQRREWRSQINQLEAEAENQNGS